MGYFSRAPGKGTSIVHNNANTILFTWDKFKIKTNQTLHYLKEQSRHRHITEFLTPLAPLRRRKKLTHLLLVPCFSPCLRQLPKQGTFPSLYTAAWLQGPRVKLLFKNWQGTRICRRQQLPADTSGLPTSC